MREVILLVTKNPSKAQRRKALLRASNTLRNYIVAADSGVAKGMYSQTDFNKMNKMIEELDKIALKMK